MKTLLKILLLVVVVGAVAFAALNPWARSHVEDTYKQLVSSPGETSKQQSETPARPPRPPGGWDKVIELTESQKQTIGLRTVVVKAQTEATVLKLAGMTAYDPATLTVVRTQFDSRVDKVLVDLGSVVKKGDPLLELFSNSLADAKSTFETASNQWGRNKKVLDYKKPLAESDALPRKELIEIENDEAQSRLAMKLAMDKLLVFGLHQKEIDDTKAEDGVKKARMTLRSVADGIVVKREVVPGNFYDPKDDLLTIAPLDHLWVRSSISEIDADKVRAGQSLRVIFPYTQRTIPGKVEYIEKAIDPDSRSAKFRTSISNPDRQFLAGAFVRVQLDLPPIPGHTVIPRVSMVSVDRDDFVFVKKPGTALRFERRAIILEREGNEQIIIDEATKSNTGLKPGEEVVTSGSLILEQMYEDRMMTEGGPLN